MKVKPGEAVIDTSIDQAQKAFDPAFPKIAFFIRSSLPLQWQLFQSPHVTVYNTGLLLKL